MSVQFVPCKENACNSTHHNNTTESTTPSHTDTGSSSNDFSLIFALLFCLEAVAYGLFEPVPRMTDAIVFSTLGSENLGSYGKVLLGAPLGFMSLAFATGSLIDFTAKHVDNPKYSYLPMFIGYTFFMIVTALSTLTIKSTGAIQSSNFGKSFWVLIKDFQFDILLMTSFIFGILCGIMFAFLNYFLDSLPGASNTLFGLMTIVACSSEVPVMFTSGWFYRRIGPVNCLYLTFVTYAIRYTAYSFLENPWLVLAIEPIHGISWGLMFSVTQAYAASFSPPGLQATGPGLTMGSQLFGKSFSSFVS